MKNGNFRQLDTSRLKLRRFCLEDAPVFFARLGGSEVVTRHMLWQTHLELSQSEKSVRKAMQQPYCWAITLAGSDELIGRIDLLSVDEVEGSCSFAYMIGADFWNRGYGTEAVTAVFDFAFRELAITHIEADHFAENPASGAVMRKAGMRRCAIAPGKYEKNGIIHDAVQYVITKEEWENR